MRHRSTLPPTEELKRLYPNIIPSLEKMGERFGCSGGTIRNRLLGAGSKLRPRGGMKGQPSGRKLVLSEEAWEQIIHEYKVQEISGGTIAKEHNVSPGVIYRGLVDRGIELREQTAHMKGWHAEQKQKLAAADMTVHHILDLRTKIKSLQTELAAAIAAKTQRQYLKVGQMVEEKLASGKDVTAARRAVATAENIAYSSVVRYHKKYRQSFRLPPG